MATQISDAGGTTTSFSNTPQAQDDLLTVTASGIPLTEDLTGVLKLNVLANDSGGAAKTLWSVDDASGSTGTSTNGNTYPTDLLTKDVTYTTDTAGLAGTSDTSSMGAKIWIGSDGYVHYDTTGVAAQLQALGAGEYFTDTFTYAIKLANGTLSWATATVRIAGTNDAPDIHLVTSDSAAASLNETNAPLTSSGTLTVNDADLSDTVAATVDSVSLGGTTGGLTSADVLGMLTLSPGPLAADPGDTHNLGWSFSSTPQNFDFLAANETLTLTYTVKANDGHGGIDTQTVTITIHGTNDAAVITGDAAGAVTEASGVSNGTAGTSPATGDLDATDVDSATDFSVVTNGVHGTLSINAAGEWSYVLNEDDAAVQALNVGDPALTDTITVQTSDGTTKDIVISINGANDAAVITGDAAGAVTEASGVSNGTAGTSPATGDLDATDVDSGTDFSVVTNGVHGTLSINAAGEWSYVLNEDDAAVQALNVGDPALTDTITVQTSDGTTKDIVISINGANDAAVITGDATGSVTEAPASPTARPAPRRRPAISTPPMSTAPPTSRS
ncbi:VCBS domain-containing protein [Mesorhizobium sp. M1B.F.Ca.ET.045.04.1.1]|uniref:VCBS domain-containing protein n=2 Tax=unclassified Mesorhizobium TaxID=325217 RepID=UPI000F762374|nr:VCBS domain-containing protein [Mesorhizobium sp. M1B.F.Ca.ET.045.04.1.1]AZO30717.1 hypothetical protein EJ071_27180 [Mesorhizobium sp. M1B.F.Ca.ET.045.04.1.1]